MQNIDVKSASIALRALKYKPSPRALRRYDDSPSAIVVVASRMHHGDSVPVNTRTQPEEKLPFFSPVFVINREGKLTFLPPDGHHSRYEERNTNSTAH